ncbi:hypothetical protein J6590_034845 [Homalodisca vitripennis]|nr:hypothetical protein J6590_034845 [Homalodisca vitripennis]
MRNKDARTERPEPMPKPAGIISRRAISEFEPPRPHTILLLSQALPLCPPRRPRGIITPIDTSILHIFKYVVDNLLYSKFNGSSQASRLPKTLTRHRDKRTIIIVTQT